MSIFSPVFRVIVVSLSATCSLSRSSAAVWRMNAFSKKSPKRKRAIVSLPAWNIFRPYSFMKVGRRRASRVTTMDWEVCMSFSRNSFVSLVSPILSCSWEKIFSWPAKIVPISLKKNGRRSGVRHVPRALEKEQAVVDLLAPA